VTGAGWGAAWATPELPAGAGPVLPVLPELPETPVLPELPEGAGPELPAGVWVAGVGPLGGPASPRSDGLASGGIFFEDVLARAVEAAEFALPEDVSAPAATALFAPNEWPGAIAETSAAMPADSAAAPPMTNRRVRVTRWSAALRSSWATDCLRCRGPLLSMCLMIDNIS